MELNRQKLIGFIENEFGIKIPMSSGAAIIKYENGSEVWLEFSEASALINIHCVVNDNVTESSLSLISMQKILRLNSRHDILCGGWLGIHEMTRTLRFYISIPVQLASFENIIQAIKNASIIKTNVTKSMIGV